MTDVPQAPPPQAPRYEWRNLGGLKTTLTWLFALDAVAAVFFVAMLLRRLGALSDIEDSGFTRRNLAEDQDAADGVIAAFGISSGLLLLTAVIFITWFFRAAKNNEALGREQARFGPGWAIGGWFIPLAFFVIPLLIAQDLWRGSDPAIPRDDRAWRAGRGSPLVGGWFATFWLSRVSVFFGRGDTDDEFFTVDEIRSSANAALVAQMLGVVAAVLAIFFVRRLTERQEKCLLAQREAWTTEHGGAPPA